MRECWVNCSSLRYTSGTIGSADCSCLSGYYWNSTAPDCWLNCSAVDNVNQTLGNINSSECGCNDGYVWNVSQSCCDIDCSGVGNATHRSDLDPLVCDCRAGFVWNSGDCDLDCSVVAYATGQASTPDGSCICKDGYLWEASIYACLVKASNYRLAYGLGFGMLGLLLLLVGLGILLFFLLASPVAISPPPQILKPKHYIVQVPLSQTTVSPSMTFLSTQSPVRQTLPRYPIIVRPYLEPSVELPYLNRPQLP